MGRPSILACGVALQTESTLPNLIKSVQGLQSHRNFHDDVSKSNCLSMIVLKNTHLETKTVRDRQRKRDIKCKQSCPFTTLYAVAALHTITSWHGQIAELYKCVNTSHLFTSKVCDHCTSLPRCHWLPWRYRFLADHWRRHWLEGWNARHYWFSASVGASIKQPGYTMPR